MNYAALRARTAYLAAQAGWSDSTPPTGYATSDLFIGALVNEAYQQLAYDTEYNIETDTFATVAGQAEYTLATATVGLRNYIYVSEAIYGTDTPLIQANESEIRRMNNLWLLDAGGTPTYFWTSTSGVLRLYQKPTAIATVTLRGPREPAALSADGDIPTCPGVFHIAICLGAVILLAESYLSEEMDLARIARYEESYALRASKLKRLAGDADDNEAQRTVAPRLPRRVTTMFVR